MEKDKSIINNSMYYGLIFGIVLLAYTIVTTLSGMTLKIMSGGFQMSMVALLLSLIIYFGGIFITQKNFRDKKLDGYIPYGKALTFGILVTVFGSFLVAVYQFIYAQWINPDFGQQVFDATRQMTIDMLERFNAPEASFDEALSKIDENGVQSPVDFAFGSITNGLVIGVIVSLITSIFVKKVNKDPFAGVSEESDS